MRPDVIKEVVTNFPSVEARLVMARQRLLVLYNTTIHLFLIQGARVKLEFINSL